MLRHLDCHSKPPKGRLLLQYVSLHVLRFLFFLMFLLLFLAGSFGLCACDSTLVPLLHKT